jgi:DNA polymerase-3 subunit epsilon
MNLILKKPLCFFDVEATGLQITTDRIVQIAIIKLTVDGEQEELNELINPEIIITDEIIAIHGISNEKVANAPTFKQLAQKIADFIGDSDLAGYNSNKYDIPLLAEEFLRADFEIDLSQRNFVDVQNIFHKKEQRTLAAAYQFYCQKSIENAHDALYDTRATLDVFLAQIARYPDLKNDVSYLADFSRAGNFKSLDFAGRLAINEKGEAIYNFGKHKEKTIESVMKSEPGYYGWLLEADFPRYTKLCLRKEMERIKQANTPKENTSMESKLNDLKSKFNRK